ncbi:MAG: V-type ATP synthase subunit F [Candidatus Marinimicrobia bacterium]|nr:V-type ATP synthase subunit F [Candidatus Neomarinimicrobiota bacterium]
MKFFVIGDEETVLGFHLVGIDGEIVDTPDQARLSLKNTIEKMDVGVILITERIADGIRADVDQYFYKMPVPLIIEIPDRYGAQKERGTIHDVIRNAIGVHV